MFVYEISFSRNTQTTTMFQTKRSQLKNQIDQDLAMVSSMCYIIRGYLKEFNKSISSNFVQSSQTASPQILHKASKSQSSNMYRFNFQDYKIKYTNIPSDKSAFENSFEGCRCLQSVTTLLLSHPFVLLPQELARKAHWPRNACSIFFYNFDLKKICFSKYLAIYSQKRAGRYVGLYI
jgi:hypothetical protein